MAAYRQLLAENHVEDILKDVKQNKNLDRKKELPVWLPLAASFKNGTRKAEDAQPSGLYFLDIDEKGLTEALWNKVREENLIEEFRIVYFAESAGGGTHIWAWRTPGISIEEDIQKLASRLGVSYDSHVTDLARCCFMVSEQYVKLLDPIVFEASPEMEADQTTPPSGHPSYSGGEEDTIAGVIVSPPELGGARGGLNERTTTYKGIPYADIVRSLMLKMGYGEQPVEGERNNALFAMSRYMRFICDFNAGWLFQVMPMLGTLATGIRAKYRDGKMQSPSFIIDIEAPQATGKSFVDDEIALLMDPIIKQDEVEWQRRLPIRWRRKTVRMWRTLVPSSV